MRVAALYDIHANLPALEAVLDDVRAAAVDLVVVGGDVLPGPMPRETLECLLSLDPPVSFISGNGDRAVHERMTGTETGNLPEQARESVHWTANQLGPEHARVLRGWPTVVRHTIDGTGDVLFCHATPRNDTEIFTRVTPEARLLPVFVDAHAALVVCGHTHMQFDRMVGVTRVVNAGSVGMPFGQSGAFWLLLGPRVELRRTPYDFDAAAARIRHTAFPGADAFVSNHLLHPPSEQAILERFAPAELR